MRLFPEIIEYDTRAKKLTLLEAITELAGDCETPHDQQMLLMAFDIISRINLKQYE